MFFQGRQDEVLGVWQRCVRRRSGLSVEGSMLTMMLGGALNVTTRVRVSRVRVKVRFELQLYEG